MMNWEIYVSSFYEETSKFAKTWFSAKWYELELSLYKLNSYYSIDSPIHPYSSSFSFSYLKDCFVELFKQKMMFHLGLITFIFAVSSFANLLVFDNI